jgi:hypothetical protein
MNCVRLVGISALVALASCRNSTPPDVYPTVAANSGLLLTAHFTNDSHTERTFSRAGSGDTTERESVVTRVDEIVGSGGNGPTITRVTTGHYAGGDYYDTLVVRRADLRPIHEHLAYLQRRLDKRFEYHGGTVHQKNVLGDSAQAFDRVYAMPVFGFSELEMLVRSLPYRRGYSAILPLYSEGDDAIEYDSVAVVDGPPRQWTVRFADPVVIAAFAVDAASRRIVGYSVVNRKTGARARKVYLP